MMVSLGRALQEALSHFIRSLTPAANGSGGSAARLPSSLLSLSGSWSRITRVSHLMMVRHGYLTITFTIT
eukprot:6704784-Pyramimonas_sp.AAC.1